MRVFLVGIKKYLGLSLAFFGALMATSASSQPAYPAQPIRLIVSFAAGGPTDVFARLIASKLEKELGQPIIVENKPGGGSNIGSEFVAKAKPDGYTLLVGTVANTTNMGIYKNLGYNTVRDFAPITQIMSSPSVLVVNADLPVKTLAELVAYVKARPGKLNYASSGAGGMQHHAGEMLKLRAGIDVLHIPYKGASAALTDIVGGQVDLMFATSAGATPLLDSGRLRALAVTTPERSPAFPALPTMIEAGVPDYQATSWYGLYVPAGTPTAVIARLNAAATKVAQAEAFKSRVASEGLVISTGTPKQLDEFMRSEQTRWARVINAAGIKAN